MKWINIADIDPPDGKIVIIWHDIFGPCFAMHKSDGSFWRDGEVVSVPNTFGAISFWKPMPDPPRGLSDQFVTYRDSMYLEMDYGMETEVGS